jgi:hypothetical protein
MSKISTAGILLDAEFDGIEMSLRLDTNGLPRENTAPLPITTIRLRGCVNSSRTWEALRDAADRQLHVEMIQGTEEDETTTVVLIDFYEDEYEILYGQIELESSEYTAEDLQRKCRRLREAYMRSEEERWATERRYDSLVEQLNQSTTGEIDRCERKLPFFEQTHPQRAVETRGQIQAYQRVLSRLSHLHKSLQKTVK